MAPKILVVLTSVGTIPGTDKPTGWYLPELAHPYAEFAKAGLEVVVASPKGGEAPLDPGSVELFRGDPASADFHAKHGALWKSTAPLASVAGRVAEFAALFYPGGHGPMFDLATDRESIALVQAFAEAGKPVAAVCHGPVALTAARRPDGKPLLDGKQCTGFSNAEEDNFQMSSLMPFMLESRIKEVGGLYKKADQPMGEMVVVEDGGKLITGQNPSSGKGVGEAIVKAVGA